jgi:hypothetical protein
VRLHEKLSSGRITREDYGQWQRFDKYPHTFFACP